jgi:excisionase family DNA binding protein
MAKEYLRAREVAVLLGVCTKHLLRMLAERKLPGLKLGRVWLVPRQALLDRLRQLLVSATHGSSTSYTTKDIVIRCRPKKKRR